MCLVQRPRKDIDVGQRGTEITSRYEREPATIIFEKRKSLKGKKALQFNLVIEDEKNSISLLSISTSKPTTMASKKE